MFHNKRRILLSCLVAMELKTGRGGKINLSQHFGGQILNSTLKENHYILPYISKAFDAGTWIFY